MPLDPSPEEWLRRHALLNRKRVEVEYLDQFAHDLKQELWIQARRRRIEYGYTRVILDVDPGHGDWGWAGVTIKPAWNGQAFGVCGYSYPDSTKYWFRYLDSLSEVNRRAFFPHFAELIVHLAAVFTAADIGAAL